MTILEKTDALLEDQVSSWPLLGNNLEKLDGALLKSFAFDGFSIHVQFNPKRIGSSAARVDKASIRQRKCFLCKENRPSEQNGVAFGRDYEILCNPYPIFRKHFTIVKTEHTPQVIEPEFGRFLDLSRELPGLVIFYNAPSCGASAPDHMHFQAGNRGFMPLEEDLGSLTRLYGKTLAADAGLTVTGISDGLRRFLILESGQKGRLEEAFTHAIRFIRNIRPGEEPMVNILAWYNREAWQVMLFPRDRHRPWQYFEEGDKNILLSPASVDMGGTLITPLEKDFLKITREDITDIFSQISFSENHFDRLSHHLVTKLNAHGSFEGS